MYVVPVGSKLFQIDKNPQYNKEKRPVSHIIT